MILAIKPLKVTFTPLAESHLEQMHDWLNRAHVMRWWGDQQTSLEQVQEKYRPRISGSIPCYGYIIDFEKISIGYIQSHWLKDFPDYAAQIFSIKDAEKMNLSEIACVDVFIADENFLNRGFGQAILKQFLTEIVFGKMQAAVCTVGPVIENKAAIRAYEKASFSHWKTVLVKGSGTEFILKLTRDHKNAGHCSFDGK